jgi:hypothetical protein
MNLWATIGSRMLKLTYWALWFFEVSAVLVICLVLFGITFQDKSGDPAELFKIFIGLPLGIAVVHFGLTNPIGKKLAEAKAND